MPSERAPSKLSENHKINVIELTELKLWPFKILYLRYMYGVLGRYSCVHV